MCRDDDEKVNNPHKARFDNVMKLLFFLIIYRTKAWTHTEVRAGWGGGGNHVILVLQTGVVVVTPTRELAKQISDVFVHFLPPGMTHGLLIGGQDLAADVEQLNTKGCVCWGGGAGGIGRSL